MDDSLPARDSTKTGIPGDDKLGSSDSNELGAPPDFSGIDKDKVLRKMDIRLIPMLAILYLLSFLDRGNASLCGNLNVSRICW